MYKDKLFQLLAPKETGTHVIKPRQTHKFKLLKVAVKLLSCTVVVEKYMTYQPKSINLFCLYSVF